MTENKYRLKGELSKFLQEAMCQNIVTQGASGLNECMHGAAVVSGYIKK